MDLLLNRFRNLSVLLVVVTVQLLLIAYQVRSSKDVPLVRVWAVTAVTPVERALELVRRNTWGFVEDYFVLLHTRQQNEKLQKEVGQLKLENQFLRTELSTADRARALSAFQTRSPSKMIAARIIGNGTGASSKTVFIDRGSGSGIESGMAVVTPDGIVGKVVDSYPTASLVLLITDANFAAGIISQKNRVRGTLKGQGHEGTVKVDYVQNEEKVDQGEWFFTSGDDRIFPKGFPVGTVTSAKNGRTLKEIYISPSGFQNGLEEVLVVLEAVHQPIPDVDVASATFNVIPPPPDVAGANAQNQSSSVLTTDADKLKDQYRQAGEAQHHTFGEGGPGTPPPDFTKIPGLREQGAGPAVAAKPTSPNATLSNGLATVQQNPVPPAQNTGKPPITVISPAPNAVQKSPAEATATKPKPRPSAPLLVTDPTDADPSEPVLGPPQRRPDPVELDEFGQPKARQAVKKKTTGVDNQTEILAPAAPPKPKLKPNVP